MSDDSAEWRALLDGCWSSCTKKTADTAAVATAVDTDAEVDHDQPIAEEETLATEEVDHDEAGATESANVASTDMPASLDISDEEPADDEEANLSEGDIEAALLAAEAELEADEEIEEAAEGGAEEEVEPADEGEAAEEENEPGVDAEEDVDNEAAVQGAAVDEEEEAAVDEMAAAQKAADTAGSAFLDAFDDLPDADTGADALPEQDDQDAAQAAVEGDEAGDDVMLIDDSDDDDNSKANAGGKGTGAQRPAAKVGVTKTVAAASVPCKVKGGKGYKGGKGGNVIGKGGSPVGKVQLNSTWKGNTQNGKGANGATAKGGNPSGKSVGKGQQNNTWKKPTWNKSPVEQQAHIKPIIAKPCIQGGAGNQVNVKTNAQVNAKGSGKAGQVQTVPRKTIQVQLGNKTLPNRSDSKDHQLKRKASWDAPGEPQKKTSNTSNDNGNQLKDMDGRAYDLKKVVINFADVGNSYGKKCLKRTDNFFDWEGVRVCVQFLTKKKIKVVGVIYENHWGTEKDSGRKVGLPNDIKKMCESIEETPKIHNANHTHADDEMTIKCAYRRNCCFMDNENYSDWKQQLRDDKIRSWLTRAQELLHMRYFFDSAGFFETIDGNIPAHLLTPVSNTKNASDQVSKKDLWTASRT